MNNGILLLDSATEVGFADPWPQGCIYGILFNIQTEDGTWSDGTVIKLWYLSSSSNTNYAPIVTNGSDNSISGTGSLVVSPVGIGLYIVAQIVSVGEGQSPINLTMSCVKTGGTGALPNTTSNPLP